MFGAAHAPLVVRPELQIPILGGSADSGVRNFAGPAESSQLKSFALTAGVSVKILSPASSQSRSEASRQRTHEFRCNGKSRQLSPTVRADTFDAFVFGRHPGRSLRAGAVSEPQQPHGDGQGAYQTARATRFSVRLTTIGVVRTLTADHSTVTALRRTLGVLVRVPLAVFASQPAHCGRSTIPPRMTWRV